jgi:hypothetical protein
MLDVHRIKKSKQIVYPLGKYDNNYTLCLIPLKQKTRRNLRGHVQIVRNDNIIKDGEDG